MTTSDNTRPRILIVVSTGFPQEQLDKFSAKWPQAEFVDATDDTVYEKVRGANALIDCRPRREFTKELLARAGESSMGTLPWGRCGGVPDPGLR